MEANLQKTEINTNINLPSLSKEAEGFLCRIATPALVAGSEFLATKFRAATFNIICELSNKYAEQQGIEIKPTPPKFLLPFIEKASLEDDTELQKKWAKLLVAAGKEYDVSYIDYSEILAKIGIKEAQLLKEIYLSQKEMDGFNSIEKYEKAMASFNHTEGLKDSLRKIDSEIKRKNRNSFLGNNNIELNLSSAFSLSAALKYRFPFIKDGEDENLEWNYCGYPPMELFTKSYNLMNSLILLQKLDLLRFNFDSHPLGNSIYRPQWKLLLTQFGYEFVRTLEGE